METRALTVAEKQVPFKEVVVVMSSGKKILSCNAGKIKNSYSELD